MAWEDRGGAQALVGRVVAVDGPAARVAEIHGAPEGDEELEACSGQQGVCVQWDVGTRRHTVLTFEGATLAAPEGSARELEPRSPGQGGFDVAWPAPGLQDAEDLVDVAAHSLATQGYCVVQMFSSPELRAGALAEAPQMFAFDGLRTELEVAYLGHGNATQCRVLDAGDAAEDGEDDAEQGEARRVAQGALAQCDRELTEAAVLLAPVLEEVLGQGVAERSHALLRVGSEDGQPLPLEDLSDADVEDQVVEAFVSWISRRKLCLLYCIENDGGSLELHPKAHLGAASVELPLQRGRLVLFRHDAMDYAYHPRGASVALQAWLLDEPACVEFRELPLPPGVQGVERVQVTGIDERFPAGCEGCDKTFTLFSSGCDAEEPVPYTRFDIDLYCMEDRDAAQYGKAYTMHGAFVDDEYVYGFDNEFFGFSLEESGAMAPSQRWVLEVGYSTLHKAGWDRERLHGQRIGTFMGDSGSEWNEIYIPPNEFQVSKNSNAITVSRLAHCMGLTGPTLTVDTACSASLVAANAAVHMMRTWTYRPGDAEPVIYNTRPSLQKALCMGVLVMVSPNGWIGECAATMLSYRGRCFTFDQTADGFIRGEGCCAAYLQTGHDEDQDGPVQPLAVVMGTCSNQDGKSASLTAPHGPSQQACIRQCLREAGLRPQDVMVGECHGTGTALGDPIEVGAVRGVMFKNRDDGPITHCTAKAHVGHEEANAGICGLVKIILMLNAATITPNPHLKSLNAHLDVNGYPVLFNTELRHTQLPEQVFGVSSFGFGGSNSRADCWADAERGAGSGGARTLLSREEAVEWINKVVATAGTPKEMDNFLLEHKPGH